MIICKSCCKTRCVKNNNCPIVPSPYRGKYPCQVCGQQSDDLIHCAFYLPIDNDVAQCSTVDRFLSLLRPVAETLADRERKYGGVYGLIRKEDGIDDLTGFIWEVKKKIFRYWTALQRGKYETAWDSLVKIAGYCVLEMELLKKYMEGRKEDTD